MRVAIIVLVVLSLFHSACSEAADAPVIPPGAQEIRNVTASGPLSLNAISESEPVEIRLAMLETPIEEQTRAALAALVEGQVLRIDPVRDAPDRYDRVIARAWRGESGREELLQAALVSQGMARVLAYPDNTPGEIAFLLDLEAGARQAGRGLWADPAFAVRDTDPDRLAQDAGRFHLVEGRVLRVAELDSGRVYLNFGSDWRTDFTVRIDERDRAVFEQAEMDLLSLESYRVRVRGVIRDENGPMIRLTHPLRLEVLAD